MLNPLAKFDVAPPNCCVNCYSPEYEEGYQTKFCKACRKDLTKVEIPLWVRLLAGIVILLTGIGIFIMPKNLSTAVHLERARKAEANLQFLTASREYAIVRNSFPTIVDYKVHLYHDYFMSGNYDKANLLYQEIQGNSTPDIEMANLINSEVDQMLLAYGDTNAIKIMQLDFADSTKLWMLNDYSDKHPTSQSALFFITNFLFDQHRFAEADVTAKKLQTLNRDFLDITNLLAAIQRELGNYDQAITYYDQILEKNIEDIGAITGKCRTELKRKNDVKAKEYLDRAQALDPDNLLTKESAILYDFCAGKKSEANSLLEQLRKETVGKSDTIIYERVRKVISGEIKYR